MTGFVITLMLIIAHGALSIVLFTLPKRAAVFYRFYLPSCHSLQLRMHLVTALNPKGIVFFVAFLPQFINTGAGVAQQLWILAVTFVALATVNATLYAVFASTARKVLSSPRAQRRFNLTGGTLLSAAGVWTLLAKRPG